MERGLLTKRTPPGCIAAASWLSTLFSSLRSTCAWLRRGQKAHRCGDAGALRHNVILIQTFYEVVPSQLSVEREGWGKKEGAHMEEDGVGENAVIEIARQVERVQVLLHSRRCRAELYEACHVS